MGVACTPKLDPKVMRVSLPIGILETLITFGSSFGVHASRACARAAVKIQCQ